MFRQSYRSLAVLFSLIFPGIIAGAAEQPKPLRFGSVAMDTPAIMHKRLTPLTEYLSKELKRPVILKLSPNMGSAIKEVANSKVDFAYLTPVAYLKSYQMGNTQIAAKTVTNNNPYFQLMIVVREDSNIKKIADLKGKSFAFGDERALLQRAVVVGSGVKLSDFSKYDFLGHYNNIVRGVLHKDYDAGILKDTKAFKWQSKGIRILYASPKLPPYNITVSSKVDKKLFRKIQKAFINLDIKNKEHLAVIKSLSNNYNGFVKAKDKDYQVVRKLIKPFNK